MCFTANQIAPCPFLCAQSYIHFFSSRRNCGLIPLDRPHTTRFLSCDASVQIQYETSGSHRGSCHLTEIGTLAIHPLTLHDNNLSRLCFLGYKTQSLRNFEHVHNVTTAAIPSDF